MTAILVLALPLLQAKPFPERPAPRSGSPCTTTWPTPEPRPRRTADDAASRRRRLGRADLAGSGPAPRLDLQSVYGGHAFGFASKERSREQEFELLLENRDHVLPRIREYSPVELLSKDDVHGSPAAFLIFVLKGRYGGIIVPDFGTGRTERASMRT